MSEFRAPHGQETDDRLRAEDVLSAIAAGAESDV
jgi:hypothetical protein